MNCVAHFAFVVAVVCAEATACMAQSPPTDWNPINQYGSQTEWKTELSVPVDTGFERAWQIAVGEGRSQVVVDADRLYVLCGKSEKQKDKPPLCKTWLLCLDRATGDQIWKRESDPQSSLKGQESFSGATLSPRSTPVILGENIITVSYTGALECVNKTDGELRWQKDLVELGATPVQFGFSSSPVAYGKETDRFYVTAAGPDGGLYCLSVEDGSEIWKSKCGSFSYATPTFANINGTEQVIAVTRNEILGIARADGKKLWSHDLREKGLTNVPTPIALEDGFIHSSQGAKGTSRVLVFQQDGQWQTKEKWYSQKAQYFYSNWTLISPQILLGVADNLLVALNIEDGSVAGRWRGFSDGNLACIRDQVYLIDGKGSLNVLRLKLDSDEPMLEHQQKVNLLESRCWTPPTLLNEGVLLRGGKELTLVKFASEGDELLENRLKAMKPLKLRKSAAAKVAVEDPVEKIFDTFSSKGAEAALALYKEYRSQKPSPLGVDERVALYNAAKNQGLDDVADMILSDAEEDFPDSREIQELSDI